MRPAPGRAREKLAALLTVTRAVSNTLDLNTILSTIAKQIRQVIQTDECTVFLFDPVENVLVPAVCDAKSYAQEMMAVRLRLGEGITGTVAVTGRGEIVNDAEADPRAITVPGTPLEQSAARCRCACRLASQRAHARRGSRCRAGRTARVPAGSILELATL